jgi:hypothetical protein
MAETRAGGKRENRDEGGGNLNRSSYSVQTTSRGGFPMALFDDAHGLFRDLWTPSPRFGLRPAQLQYATPPSVLEKVKRLRGVLGVIALHTRIASPSAVMPT